ncbi:hypothetical protein BDV29DRAFT_157961 [Aspergillus leporis]|uniref:Amidohydrolase 3 domain-containing protein n=1 Tax=Aspergillus leporis TaxID=41062 RepID=A0A5N5X0Y0_9EURO|nr:hypothetical protein BDV29DRAFT_157961 [Aspergillus leporis]
MASWMSLDQSLELYSGPPRNVAFIDNLAFDPKLQPREYQIAETSSSSKILIHDVNIFDTTGREPYRGDVLIIGERYAKVGIVGKKDDLQRDPSVRVFHGRGRTLIPGLGDAHTHLS